MATPQFNQYEFVNATNLNSAVTTLVGAEEELAANDVFFIPGLINQSSLVFSFNGNLTVTLTMTNSGVSAFKVLFQTGAISGAFGTATATTTNVYSVNLTPFVPAAGSQIVYIVAQFTQIQQDPQTILGPPPGHPDYSPEFVPTIGYTELFNSLNIFGTTTAPDNQVTIELARATLTAGQTVVSAVDVSHQVRAMVNALYVVMSGDVTGLSNNNTINFLQGRPVNTNSPAPVVNQALTFNGSNWAPQYPAVFLQYSSTHLVGKTTNTSQITITSDLFVLKNPTTGFVITTPNFSGTCTVVGSQPSGQLNGRDQSGGFGNNTFFHLYAIGALGQTTGLIASLSGPPSGPTLLANYTSWVYLGTFLTNNSGNLVPMYLNGNTILYSLAQTVLQAVYTAPPNNFRSTSSFVPSVAQTVQFFLISIGGSSQTIGSFGPDSNTTFNVIVPTPTWFVDVFNTGPVSTWMPNTQRLYFGLDPTLGGEVFGWVLGYTVPNNAS